MIFPNLIQPTYGGAFCCNSSRICHNLKSLSVWVVFQSVLFLICNATQTTTTRRMWKNGSNWLGLTLFLNYITCYNKLSVDDVGWPEAAIHLAWRATCFKDSNPSAALQRLFLHMQYFLIISLVLGLQLTVWERNKPSSILLGCFTISGHDALGYCSNQCGLQRWDADVQIISK